MKINPKGLKYLVSNKYNFYTTKIERNNGNDKFRNPRFYEINLFSSKQNL